MGGARGETAWLVVAVHAAGLGVRHGVGRHIGARRYLAAALEQWHGKYPEVRVRQDVIRGHPARVLASYSAPADLVVLGRHGHPAGPGPGIGSIQHAVLDHAHGPVAIVPLGD